MFRLLVANAVLAFANLGLGMWRVLDDNFPTGLDPLRFTITALLMCTTLTTLWLTTRNRRREQPAVAED